MNASCHALKIVTITCGATALLLQAGCAFLTPQPSAVSQPAQQLCDTLNQDAVMADAQYKGQALSLPATVAAIQSGQKSPFDYLPGNARANPRGNRNAAGKGAAVTLMEAPYAYVVTLTTETGKRPSSTDMLPAAAIIFAETDNNPRAVQTAPGIAEGQSVQVSGIIARLSTDTRQSCHITLRDASFVPLRR